MFPWNIAKSAEAMFSRWAIKNVCKFLLKKKLGQFILGDIDLNQLDVQLRAGTIQLSDLALNVDYINQKLDSAAVIVKEGSIGSLLVKIPWKGKSCQIDLDELELVLAPCVENNLQAGVKTSTGTSTSSQDVKQHTSHGLQKLEHEVANKVSASPSVDVHEGVKTIAKMVKWLLTSFHIKVKKLIVAFEPCLNKDESKSEYQKTLVLRITETECGTYVSEDANVSSGVESDSFLGMTRLTNFVKFHGAFIELLQTDDVDNQTQSPCACGKTFGQWYLGNCSSNSPIPVLTGGSGGFAGSLKLSIPWKNGSLDIRKVDADVSIDSLELIFQPSTIRWFICLWESLKNIDKDARIHMQHKATGLAYPSSASLYQSSTPCASMITSDIVTPKSESSSSGFYSLVSQETGTDALLPGSHLIPDWVPLSFNKNANDRDEVEHNFGASVDHFFECFDGMRSSQSALGNSGIWNWTCSVFSAITAASSLASGSLHIPSEQQHVETNLKATIAGVSVVLSLHDEYQKHSCNLMSDDATFVENIHYLNMKCLDLLLVLQICPRKKKFEAIVMHIELDDYFSSGNALTSGLLGYESGICKQILPIQHLQAEVQHALPSFPLLFQDSDPKKTTSGLNTLDFPSSRQGINFRTICKEDLVKVKFLKTSSVSHCQFTLNLTCSDDNLSGSTSFSLNLPPFIFWVNFHLLNMLLDLLKQVTSSFEIINNANKCFEADALNRKHDLSSHGNVKRQTYPYVTTLSPKRSLQGNIFLPNARVILCFPFEKNGDNGRYASWDQFIALDFSSPLNNEKVPDASSQSGYSSVASGSLHLNVGNLKIYLITSSCKDGLRSNCYTNHIKTFSSQKILSVNSRIGCLSCISMLWQEGPVTGPWIAKQAKSLATSQDLKRSRNKATGYEFASVTTVKDLEDINSRTHQEMILSSASFLHIRLFPVSINLDSSQYKGMHHLINQILDGLSYAPCETSVAPGYKDDKIEDVKSQTSLLVECNSVEILINLDKVEEVKCSIQKELPGSWHSIKLKVQRFELLSVSNIGGISGANFFWLGHGEGELWGSITGFPTRELLLISCSNSTMQRGDGEGANALSSGSAGTIIARLWDPQTFQGFTSITVRCCTLVAPGGRLDWLNAICYFFSLPSQENEQGKGSSENGSSCGSLLLLNFVDIALSYEPYMKNLVASSETMESGFNDSAKLMQDSGEKYVACLLAAASINLSNQTFANCMENDYKIRVQDLGLLLRALSGLEDASSSYTVEYLRHVGYVKVASEALVEAVLRTNCKNGHLWEVECSEFCINLSTCHDTTSGVICLVAQLQQLFAPDVEESIVHLQTRWNTVQQAHDGHCIVSNTAALSLHAQSSSLDSKCRSGTVGLMDDICENAFNVNENPRGTSWSSESQLNGFLDGCLFGEGCNMEISAPESFSRNFSFNGSMSGTRVESTQTSSPQKDCFPEFIEGYCLSEFCPSSELSTTNQPLHDDLKCEPWNGGHGYVGSGSGGWYQDTSLRIVEDHISQGSEQPGEKQVPGEHKHSSIHNTGSDSFCKAIGQVLLKNIEVRWHMYAGSDWNDQDNNNIQRIANKCGRDATIYLELALSGMSLQYDIFPDGEICVSKLSLSVKDLYLYDRSRDAPWKLVLGYYHSRDHPRESSAKAFKLELESVRPDPLTPLEEYRLRLAFLPILLHLHQGQLDFLVSFFGGKESKVDQSLSSHDLDGSSMVPVGNFGEHTIAEEALLPYFQKFDICPVLIRVDYSPCRVDLAALRGGKYVELVNLVPWKGIELQLKHVHAVGVYGWSSVCETIAGAWLEDISQTQVHKLLKGLPTVRSLFAVGSGAAKLVSLPVKNYRKDHRLLKGVQRGAIAFLRSISLEAVGLGVHLAAGAHDILLQTEYILASIPPSPPWSIRSRARTNVRSNQPKDAQQGIRQAYECLSDGLEKTASALVGTPMKTYQRGAGAASALATAVCAAPAAAIAPASAAARAVHCALLGVRNSLDPEHKKESMEKYLGPSQPQDHS
uniref:Autophagy-related protein 2 n=1 Tax=Nelumbo nucifera TaxID=4432 RepID=A0A822ZCM0_NELNU|nr:TPA_asm: hypothetical protein HUJ06_015562 [Nelumbo nucifera]